MLTLRGLEYALGQATATNAVPGVATSAAPTWVHFPLTAWFGEPFVGASVASLENAIVVVAALKIFISMAWFIVIALQPTMGVAWHRFLAFVNIWFKRTRAGTRTAG